MMVIAISAAWLLLSTGATRDQLDALRTAGTLGVGFGGVVALWLAVRRQRSTEHDLLQKYQAHELAERVAAQNQAAADRAAAHAEHDARERRLTDLYLKAVEHLGSAHAPVRHGGLYALERVAQDNPSQRQTVVDVVCAYLRAPYTPPNTSRASRLGLKRPLQSSTRSRATNSARARETTTTSAHTRTISASLEEREVRMTAQRLLKRHLSLDIHDNSTGLFWDNIDLDLAGATLVSFDFRGCRVKHCTFLHSTFVGPARFDNAVFTGEASFARSAFTAEARFSGATFANETWFKGATFTDGPIFNGTTFSGEYFFQEVNFAGNAQFDGTLFTEGTPVEVSAHLDGQSRSASP
ncbi:pentapeptide repeat-containing protein [Amycolatopsis mediterranei]